MCTMCDEVNYNYKTVSFIIIAEEVSAVLGGVNRQVVNKFGFHLHGHKFESIS